MFGITDNLGATATSVLLFLALGSTVVMWWSWLKAIRLSRGTPEFDALIGARRYVGYEAISKMPPHARRYVRQHFVAIAVFFMAPLILALAGE